MGLQYLSSLSTSKSKLNNIDTGTYRTTLPHLVGRDRFQNKTTQHIMATTVFEAGKRISEVHIEGLVRPRDD
jgi:hypothetical protein